MFNNRKELYDHVRDWVRDITGLRCFIQNQMGPAPSETYATVHLGAVTKPDFDINTYNEDQTQETVRGFSRCVFDISVWGAGADDYCDLLRSSLNSERRVFDLYTKVGRGLVGEIQDLSTNFRGIIEERAEFRVVFWTSLPKTFDTDYFNSDRIIINETEKGQVADFTVGPVTT